MVKFPVHRFLGMNNMSGGVFPDSPAVPDLISDAVSCYDGIMRKRAGQRIVLPFTSASDIWKSPVTGNIYMVDGGSLNILSRDFSEVSPIHDVPMGGKVYYVSVGDKDYMGNEEWFLVVHNKVAGPVGQSITELNEMPWETTSEGLVLYLKNPAGEETVVPHPSEFAHTPMPLKYLCHRHGRLWGARGNKVFYSHPMLVDWWDDKKCFFEFTSEVKVLVLVQGGVFVGTEDRVEFLQGTDPAEMYPRVVSWEGAVEHSMVISPKSSEMPAETPLFMTTDGYIVACFPDGNLGHVTRDRLLISPHEQCRAGRIKMNGVDTLLFKIKEENYG